MIAMVAGELGVAQPVAISWLVVVVERESDTGETNGTEPVEGCHMLASSCRMNSRRQ